MDGLRHPPNDISRGSEGKREREIESERKKNSWRSAGFQKENQNSLKQVSMQESYDILRNVSSRGEKEGGNIATGGLI